MRHMLRRQETRWPGYYYRADYPQLDDANWRVFVNSRYDATHDQWTLMTRPYINLVAS
jgi:adenylylsulfate reductase, subunit A